MALRGKLEAAGAAVAATPGDAALVRALLAGEERAFRALIDRHLARVLAVARRMLGDPAEADDVAQETFLRLWRKAGEIEIGGAGLAGWLYRVAANLSLDRLRARKPQDPDALLDLAIGPRQGKAIGEAHLRRAVEGALQALPERQRLSVVLCHYEELSMAEAADIMGTTAEAVESLLARGRRALRSSLAGFWRDLLPEEGGE